MITVKMKHPTMKISNAQRIRIDNIEFSDFAPGKRKHKPFDVL